MTKAVDLALLWIAVGKKLPAKLLMVISYQLSTDITVAGQRRILHMHHRLRHGSVAAPTHSGVSGTFAYQYSVFNILTVEATEEKREFVTLGSKIAIFALQDIIF